eukprot:scaffold81478_cov59-Cyclotella_meneghiniana.AAC.3
MVLWTVWCWPGSQYPPSDASIVSTIVLAIDCVRWGVCIGRLWTTAADLRAMVGVFVVLLSLAFWFARKI